MKSNNSNSSESFLRDSPDFSIVLGGPFFQLLRRGRLTDDTLHLLNRRLIFIPMFAWLPLLILTALEGNFLGGHVTVSFFNDLEVHARFLVALPLLIFAELFAHQRMRYMVKYFLGRSLIPENAIPRFKAIVDSAFRLRNSLTAEAVLIGLVYAVGVTVVWRQFIAIDALTWYTASSPEGATLSFAGMWFGFVSLPIFQFLLIRWYFRFFIWVRFLWQVSRINLQLVPTHPDRAGGLGFMSSTVYAFVPLLMAHGALLAGMLASRIFFLGAQLTDFKAEIVTLVIFLLCMVVGPLLVFSIQLNQAQRTGSREYGTLAHRYVSEFDAKWLRGGAPADEPLMGSGDIQSLADMGNSYEVVRTMRSIPVTRETLIHLALAVLIPIAPLVLTMVPLEELLKKLFGIIF